MGDVSWTFRSLVSSADRKFARVRDLPVHVGHHGPHHHHYFHKVFKAYTKLWKYQQEYRPKLVESGLQRWEIGEIASRIGQLYYGQYMRTSEARFLLESYVFYEAILNRGYFEASKGAVRDLGLRYKELRFYARFLIVSLVLNRKETVRVLMDRFRVLVEKSRVEFPDTNFKEWKQVVQEIIKFLKVDTTFMDIRPLRYCILFDSHPESLPHVSGFRPRRVLKLQDALVTSYRHNEVKFTELTLDSFRMLQCLEWEPSGSFFQMRTTTTDNGAYSDQTGASGLIDINLAADMTDPTLPPNPRKAILYHPSVTHLIAVIATICEELSPDSILLIYISASGKAARVIDSRREISGALRNSSNVNIISQTSHQRDSSLPRPPTYEKGDSSDLGSYLCLGSRGSGGVNNLYPGDIIPFTRRPLFLIIDSDNSHAFKVVHGAEKGETAALLLSPRQPALLSRQKSTVEITEEYLNRLRQTEPHIRSFLHVSEEKAIREAEEVDRTVDSNGKLGKLAGVLIGVKDNICTVDMPSTGGSKILDGYRPAFDATAVKRLRECGAIVVGKTNLDEFGMGSSTEGSGFQVTANPWDVSRVPGGSSGGSAAAVSARQCVVSLGSDTGGSVRQPASFCGVVGIKPTYGRISRYGLMAYASSLDVIGCFGSSVIDTAILLSVISGHDGLDATSSKREVPDYASHLVAAEFLESKPLKGLRVGVIRETLGEGVDAGVISSIQAAASHFEELGSIVTEVSLPSFSLGLPAYYILASSESSSNLSRYDGIRYGRQVAADELNSLYGDSRANGFGPEVKMRILAGTYALSAGYYDAYYKRAQQVRTLIQKNFKAALDQNDILISPAAPSAAYKIGEKTNDPLSMYAGDIMTVNVNLAGLPALVVPCGFVDGGPAGLPVGLQIIGPAFDEVKLLRVGHIFEQTLQGCRFVPPLLDDDFAC